MPTTRAFGDREGEGEGFDGDLDLEVCRIMKPILLVSYSWEVTVTVSFLGASLSSTYFKILPLSELTYPKTSVSL